MAATKRTVLPSREVTTPSDWHGEHFAATCPGLSVLVLWSIVNDDAGYGFCMHRASLRIGPQGTPEISFDSPSLKSKKRNWIRLGSDLLWMLPPEHKRAIAEWHRGEW